MHRFCAQSAEPTTRSCFLKISQVQILHAEFRYGGSNVPKTNKSLSRQAEMSVYVRGRMACSLLHEGTKHDPFKVIASSWTGHERGRHHRHITKTGNWIFLYLLSLCFLSPYRSVSLLQTPGLFLATRVPENLQFPWCLTSAQSLNEGVCLVPVCPLSVCAAACVKRREGGLLFLPFLMNVAFLSFRSCHRCMHGCTRLEFICTKHIFTYDRC